MSNRPLEGLKIIDCTHVLAGPFCAYQLGMLGADVIRVEPVAVTDSVRLHGPREDMNVKGLGAGFLGQGANKRAIGLNLKAAEGAALFKRLAAETDVLVENFRPGKMDSLGLGFESLAPTNDKLVYCSITGYGQIGPKRDTPAYDHVMQAVSGFMTVNGSSENPQRVGFPVIDYVTGLQASQAILAALVQRNGKARHVDISMLESALSVMNSFVTEVTLTGEFKARAPGQALSGSPFSGVFETLKGALAVTANTRDQATRLLRTLGQHDLLADSRLDDWRAHPELANELAQIFRAVYATDTALNWETRLNEAGVPAGKVRALTEAVAHPHLKELGMLQNAGVFTDTGETITVPGMGVRYDGKALPVAQFPAAPGQHTDEVLRELGLTADELSDLRSRDIIN